MRFILVTGKFFIVPICVKITMLFSVSCEVDIISSLKSTNTEILNRNEYAHIVNYNKMANLSLWWKPAIGAIRL